MAQPRVDQDLAQRTSLCFVMVTGLARTVNPAGRLSSYSLGPGLSCTSESLLFTMAFFFSWIPQTYEGLDRG